MNTIALIVGYATICIGTIIGLIIVGCLFLDRLTYAYAFTRGAYNVKGMVKPGKSVFQVFWYGFWKEQPTSRTTITSSSGYRVCSWDSMTKWSYAEKQK